MKDLVFASANKHKIEEVAALMKPLGIKVLGMAEVGIHEDIEETGDTLQANAAIKANFVFHQTGKPCFADDTGLEVKALNNAPGVYSARFAGEPSNSENNIDKLLELMENETNRKAQFRTVIAYHDTQKLHFFEGIVEGEILTKRQGKGGFGYDPVFKPNSYDISFAEFSIEEKNRISHRGLAIQNFLKYLAGE